MSPFTGLVKIIELFMRGNLLYLAYISITHALNQEKRVVGFAAIIAILKVLVYTTCDSFYSATRKDTYTTVTKVNQLHDLNLTRYYII